jgi:predicted transposase YdaD
MSSPRKPPENEEIERTLIDRALKALAPGFHAELAAWLVGERPIKVEAIEPGLATVSERARDKLLRLEFAARPPLRMHIELQLQGRANVPRRIAEYLAMDLRAEPPPDRREPLACAVVYLDEARYRHDPGYFEYEGALGTRLRVDYQVVKLWEVDPRTILDLESPGLCVLAPFLRGDKKALCVESSRRIRRSKAPEGLKRDLLAVLAILAARKITDRTFLQRFLQEMKDMTGNYVIDYFLKQGEDRGAEKGRVEGAQIEARRMLLRALTKRFGPLPKRLRVAVEAIASRRRLEQLHDAAITCPDIKAFRRRLGG